MQALKIALVGNPNCGKTTMFNEQKYVATFLST